MNGHIRHLHCHYRVHGNRDTAPQISSRLTRVLKDDLLDAYEEAMDKVYGDDPSVIVIRKLNSRLAVALNDYPNDRQLAARWGGRLAGNLVRRIATAGEGDEGLIRFNNQAEYVTSYIADLINEHLKHRWYYGAFNYLKGQSRGETLCQLLTDNRRHLGKILSLLQQRGLLQRTLLSMDGSMLKRLWTEAIRRQSINVMDTIIQAQGNQSSPTDQHQSLIEKMGSDANQLSQPASLNVGTDQQLFEQALNLLRRLSLIPEHGQDVAGLMSHFHPHIVVDWRDQKSLTAAFCEIIDFLQSQHQVRRINIQASPDILMLLDETLREFDWLDTAQLRTHLLQDRTTRQPRSLTPRQRDLLTALSFVLNSATPVSNLETDEAVALQLYAQLLTAHPQWTDDELAKRLIEALAHIHIEFSQHNHAEQLRALLRKGRVSDVVEQLRQVEKDKLNQALSLIDGLGEPAMDLLDAMAGDDSQEQDNRLVTTQCAGVFLLLRAVADMRLPVLIKEYPGLSIENLLLSILIRIAGEGAVHNGQLDAGLAELLTSSNKFDDLQQAWNVVEAEQHDAFQFSVLKILAGQRLISGNRLNLYRLEQQDGTAWLIGGDAGAQVWSLSCSITAADAVEQIITHWIDAWTQATGRVPEISVDASLAQYCSSALVVDSFEAAEAATVITQADDPSILHIKGRENLVQALTTLAANQLGMVRADLQCALLAIGVIRLWARWLNHFSTASVPYLLDSLIRRAGMLTVSEDCIDVQMDPAPLDVVIEMAAYLNDLERLDWLGGRTIKYRIRR
jgi:hypothetical protein